MEMKDFRDKLLEDAKLNSITEKTSEKGEFFDLVIDMLKEAEEIEDEFYYVPYETIGSNRKKIQIDGYCYSQLDECLSIFSSSPISSAMDEIETLTATDADKIFTRAKNIIEEADFIYKNGEESAPGYGFVSDIIGQYANVNKYNIYLISDMLMSKNIKELKSDDINGIPVEYNIWDLSRLYQLSESQTGKEDIVIDLKEFSGNGIPCLPASKTADYTAYLCNISGEILAKLYNKYGGRLLEGNVRSFLQTKGKVNKGIRNTILNDANMFFAYNNGIAATASDLKIENINGVCCITEIKALQIVNGGQTTASLAMALLNDKKDSSEEKIKNIFVPMKLSVVSPDKAQDLIPNISRYANSQNKVSDADLWSNHPFHIRMEEFSRRILAPAIDGKQYGTYWYYERANGQYRQETYKSTDAVKKKFELQNPKNQMFKKVDLAKYMNIYMMLPHIASAGGQKSFAKFADWVSKKWKESELFFNDDFFKRAVAITIIFKTTDKIAKENRYNSYKANIVAYTISKIIYDVENKLPDYAINYRDIWDKQKLSNEFQYQIKITMAEIYKLLTDPDRGVENVTEWAKREGCWDNIKGTKTPFYQPFINTFIRKSTEQEQKQKAKESQKLEKKLSGTIGVVKFGANNWRDLLSWNESHNVLNLTEVDFINVAIGIERGKIPTDKQSKRILQILEKAREEGFPK